ncbi:hypothetical protein [Mycoplasma sp. ATU-Cv-508]|uniref:hypothetical protein n=1 Tax=Mycoplasma sp. ATU-Cv-508 TaxID=2048001 RepID=UPI000FDEC40E
MPGQPKDAAKGYLIRDILASTRWNWGKKLEYDVSFEKLLGNLGVTFIFEKVESTDFLNHIAESKFTKNEKPNVTVSFRPRLLYNSEAYIMEENKMPGRSFCELWSGFHANRRRRWR